MTRSSRHKSSKRSSRDAREYSDSEKVSSPKERKGKDESSGARVSKESGEKRNWKESKDVIGSGNGEYEEYNISSKRRKDRAEDSGNDRWNGGGEDDRTEFGLKKSKVSSETKSKRRDDDEVPRLKSEGKHRESSRKESREVEKEKEREREKDKERKGKDSKSERLTESEELSKQLGNNEKTGKVTDCSCCNFDYL